MDPDRTEDIEAAITRNEIRKLIHEGVIRSPAKKGISRARARVLHEKKKKGLRRGPGLKSGAAQTKISKKQAWIKKIRPLRKKLREMKANRTITESVYRQLYNMAGSGVFESTSDLERHITTHGLGRKR
jgi:large subunit ribosomal protein L19e